MGTVSFLINFTKILVLDYAKYRTRTKHIAMKYHYFRDHVKREIININRIDTNNQLDDIFIKSLPKVQFDKLRNEIQGWMSILTKLPNNDYEYNSFNTKQLQS